MKLYPEMNESSSTCLLEEEADMLDTLVASFEQKANFDKYRSFYDDIEPTERDTSCEEREATDTSNTSNDSSNDSSNDIETEENDGDIETEEVVPVSILSPEKSTKKVVSFQRSESSDARGARKKGYRRNQIRRKKRREARQDKEEDRTVDFITTVLDGTVWNDFNDILYEADQDVAKRMSKSSTRRTKNDDARKLAHGKENGGKTMFSRRKEQGETIFKLMLQSLEDAFVVFSERESACGASPISSATSCGRYYATSTSSSGAIQETSSGKTRQKSGEQRDAPPTTLTSGANPGGRYWSSPVMRRNRSSTAPSKSVYLKKSTNAKSSTRVGGLRRSALNKLASLARLRKMTGVSKESVKSG